MFLTRRDFIKIAPALLCLAFVPRALAAIGQFIVPGHDPNVSNFKAIYANPVLRDRFLLFLQNVYSLYPDKEFHRMIYEVTSAHATDEEIYKELQKRVPEIKPFLSLFTKSLPALSKQKDEMAAQTRELIQDMKQANGYVEIGSTGRYVRGITKAIDVKGKTYLLNTQNPGFSPEDIAERGRIRKLGEFVDMADYRPVNPLQIAPGSVDLVSNYIGFHHAPPERRDPFMNSVADLIRPGGRLILRDHDVDNNDMKFIVALAHDVFNMGLDVSWDANAAEVRNFVTLSEIEERLAKYGLKKEKSTLLQAGDPTRNTLAVFVKA
jgi:SAM-dependent methyltransferase